MPVAVKRSSAGITAQQLAEEAQAKAREQERQSVRLEQIAERRAEAMDVIGRMGKGMMLWRERGWEWEDPAPESDPETWPPVAKLLWLHTRLDRLLNDLQVLISMGDPLWCDDCRGDAEFPGRGWVKGPCANHADVNLRSGAGHRATMLCEVVS